MSRAISDDYRIQRLKDHGYNPIHLFGRWYLGREWSKNCRRWYARIPLYRPFYLRKISVLCTDEVVEIDIDQLRLNK
jgi:hypothetical protein